jgi:nitrous oxide reductase accessory protein NosL
MSIMVSVIICVVMFTGGDVSGQTVSDPAIYLDKTPRSLMIMTCDYCGMDRGQYAHSRMFITYDDLTEFGACSLHCAALDLATHLDKTPKRIHVGDYQTKQIIDAERDFWVIGGNKMGVMTERGKWAFERKKDAETFMRSNGGVLVTFDEAIKAAYEDMYSDWKTIRNRKKVKKMQMPSEHKH